MKSFPFGTGAAIFIALYLALMLGLGFVARRFRKNESPSEFYLAGKSLGGFVPCLHYMPRSTAETPCWATLAKLTGLVSPGS